MIMLENLFVFPKRCFFLFFGPSSNDFLSQIDYLSMLSDIFIDIINLLYVSVSIRLSLG